MLFFYPRWKKKNFYIQFSYRPLSKATDLYFCLFQHAKKVICFYAISLSKKCTIFEQTIGQAQVSDPYSYVFLTCKEVICFYAISLSNYLFIHFYVSFSHRPWSKVSIHTLTSFSTCKEVICFYAISLSFFFFYFLFFFHFYVSFSHRLWSKVSIHTFLSF